VAADADARPLRPVEPAIARFPSNVGPDASLDVLVAGDTARLGRMVLDDRSSSGWDPTWRLTASLEEAQS